MTMSALSPKTATVSPVRARSMWAIVVSAVLLMVFWPQISAATHAPSPPAPAAAPEGELVRLHLETSLTGMAMLTVGVRPSPSEVRDPPVSKPTNLVRHAL